MAGARPKEHSASSDEQLAATDMYEPKVESSTKSKSAVIMATTGRLESVRFDVDRT